MRDNTPRRNQWLKSFITTTLVVSLAACSLMGDKKESSPLDRAYKDKGELTLADLKPVDISINQQQLQPVPAEKVIDTYKQALALFTQEEERLAILRRMADLTMVGSEERAIADLEDTQIDVTDPQVAIIDQTVEAVASDDTAVDKDSLTYNNAIELYLEIINNAPPGVDLSESYYLLAKAYDLNGAPDKSLETLDQLISKFPDSEYQAEAQFRRGEQLFLLGEYQLAADAYKDVIRFGKESIYYEQALYKHGWSLYKLADYDLSISEFVALMDIYLPPPPPPKTDENQSGSDSTAQSPEAIADTASPITVNGQSIVPEDPEAAAETSDTAVTDNASTDEETHQQPEISPTQRKILDDTLRVTALAFSNLEGFSSIAEYFKANGHRHYEVEIYNALANLYLYQERFKDAADTYEAFTQVHPLHPMAPSMSSRVIDTFLKGGFPSLVLPYKERFVTKYGIYSDYWKQATPESRKLYEKELKQHLVELANHYHAKAQTTKTQPDYLVAARWYREYLTTFPLDKYSPQMNQLLAEVLFAAKDFRGAIEEFERTAYYYPESPSSEKAGYFALLSYQEFINGLAKDDPTHRGWIVKKTASSLKFVKRFPSNKETPNILNNVIEDQLALEDMEGVITSTMMMIKLTPPPPQKLWEKAWLTRANALFDIGRWQEAETTITKVFEVIKLSSTQSKRLHENRATAIYKQAEAMQLMNRPKEAAAEFLRVAMVEPKSKIRPTAEYDAANILLQLEEWAPAIEVLENFRRNYPNHELIGTLPAKLSLAYEKTGRWALAAGELETIASSNKENNPELAREAYWQSAQLYDRTKNTDKAIAQYKSYYWAYEEPFSQRMEAQQRLAALYKVKGDANKRNFWLNKIVENYFKGGDQNTLQSQQLAAASAIELAEPEYNRFKRIRLTQPLKTSLNKKRKAMQAATKAYTRIAEIGVIEQTTKSTHRIGEIYRDFAKSIMDSERPKGLDDLALEEYDILLEDKAIPFEDKAIEIFQTNTRRTLDGVWDNWVKESYQSLEKLSPGRYKKQELKEDFVDEIF
ncbi:MAG: tetratricopeptide repeat protein [Pseudomonadales bacterium]|nr:tetratricopeptide repeat protein [Pseudomonadales bacterium]